MNKLDLMVFNVGQGLSVALVERPDNYVTLVDLGASTGFTPLKRLCLSDKLRVDVLYITHPHADHINDVETALDPNFQPYGMYYQTYDWADVKKRERPELSYKIDLFRELIGSVRLKQYAGAANLTTWCYTPNDAKKGFKEDSYINNSSLFLVYRWRDFKVSIAGDFESDAMTALVNAEKVQASAKATDILIPSHHGHKNGFPTGWVEKMGKPYVSIVSVQERDPNVDSRYRSGDFARGVPFGGQTRYALTTRADGNLGVAMWYDTEGKPKWSFSNF